MNHLAKQRSGLRHAPGLLQQESEAAARLFAGIIRGERGVFGQRLFDLALLLLAARVQQVPVRTIEAGMGGAQAFQGRARARMIAEGDSARARPA